MSSVQKDFYKVLGLHDSAEFAVIKAAYKALIMLYHPDRYMGDKDKAVKKSKDINEAYAVLIDPDKRKKYDAERLGRPERTSDKTEELTDKSENTLKVLDELRRTLQESEAILNILNMTD